MRTVVRFNDETGRFQIVAVDDDGNVTEVIQTFPEGTTNAEACKEYDLWTARNG